MSLWFTLDEILPHCGEALPNSMAGLSDFAVRHGWRKDAARARIRFGRGGGYEYHYTLLPLAVQASLGIGLGDTPDDDEAAIEPRANALWQAFERASDKEKQRARERLDAVTAVLRMGNAAQRAVAVSVIAKERAIAPSSLWRWLGIAESVPKADRLPALMDRHGGGAAQAAIDPRAWDFIKADYLRPESARFSACYRRAQIAAAANGWGELPAEKTLLRRLRREVPQAMLDLARKGADAAKRIYPHQTRTRAHFGPLQAMNADGHRFDVFVKFEDGTIQRPHMVAFQDLRSGVIVGHRIDQTLSAELVRLAFADVVTRYAIPEKLWLDNGREFASKWLTGGMRHRFRFKVRPEDPKGIFTALVGEVHWTTPYHGQAKPIERAFRDLAEDISKHPEFAGAYTGHNPMAKPANYGNAAVPVDIFRAVVAREIEAHNNRRGRRGRDMHGRSFNEVLQESLNSAILPPRRASAEQRRMLLMAAEGVTARGETGEIHLHGNRFWHDRLPDVRGQKMVVRFDPQDLKAPLAVYDLAGKFYCEAECIAETGFDDIDAARDFNRTRKAWLKNQKDGLALERRMDIRQVADLSPKPDVTIPDPPRVIRLVANGAPRAPVEDIVDSEGFGAGIAMLEQSGVLPFRKKEGGED